MNSLGAIMTEWSVISSGKNGMLICVSACISRDRVAYAPAGDDRPDMKDLNRYVVQQQAAQWEELGLELGLERHHINNITKDHPSEAVIGCGKMLQKWLDIDSSASWRKLHDAVRRIRSPTIGSTSTVSSPDSTGSVFMICSSA